MDNDLLLKLEKLQQALLTTAPENLPHLQCRIQLLIARVLIRAFASDDLHLKFEVQVAPDPDVE